MVMYLERSRGIWVVFGDGVNKFCWWLDEGREDKGGIKGNVCIFGLVFVGIGMFFIENGKIGEK